MLANKNRESEVDEKVRQLRERHNAIKTKLDSYKNFHKGMPISELLNVTSSFIEC